MTKIIRIPKLFYDDCEDCETGTPPIVRETKAHYFVDIDCDPELLEDFTSRAALYRAPTGFDACCLPICRSARATLAALGAEAQAAARIEKKRLADIEDARHTVGWLDFAEKSDHAKFNGDIDY